MKLLRTLVTVVVVLAMVAAGVLFALQNAVAVPLDLLVYTLAPRSLALWILLAFALGGIVGLLVSSLMMVRLRASAASLRRQLGRARAEVDKLRTAGLADSE
jgi:putative membrane protein